MRTLTRLRANFQSAINGSDAFPHVDESKAEMVRANAIEVESDSAVVDGERHLMSVARQLEFDARGVRVLRHVGETFLSDPIEA
jgi:hypothetical protein